MEPENNALMVRQAFERVKTDFKLVLVGDAPYAAEYIKQVKDTCDPASSSPAPFTARGTGSSSRTALSTSRPLKLEALTQPLLKPWARGAMVLYLETPENSEVAGDAGIPFNGDLVERLQAAVDAHQAERSMWGAAP